MRRLTLGAILMLVLISSAVLIEGTTRRSLQRLIDRHEQTLRGNENEKAKNRHPSDSGEYNHHGCPRRDVDCWSTTKQTGD